MRSLTECICFFSFLMNGFYFFLGTSCQLEQRWRETNLIRVLAKVTLCNQKSHKHRPFPFFFLFSSKQTITCNPPGRVIHHKISLFNQHAQEDCRLLIITWSTQVRSRAPSQSEWTGRGIPWSPTPRIWPAASFPSHKAEIKFGVIAAKGKQPDTRLSDSFPPPAPLLGLPLVGVYTRTHSSLSLSHTHLAQFPYLRDISPLDFDSYTGRGCELRICMEKIFSCGVSR